MENKKIVCRLNRKIGWLENEAENNSRNYTSEEVAEMLKEIYDGYKSIKIMER